ncbi:AraC family transcriptional regulator [Glaciecola sp. KUL10]|uniref:helix-turn-helix domain-containing protein n=1 Tax=Glaciecola sp. (strain KUL10) TaxID=2161813 RepID=UPI000D788045|nr:AraC family transcriptional regulator [Glaciecola sp. KUL10]GBL05292.1 AraC family transcriptional regulator [Glaciecola sp. KUL10]
MKPNHFYCEPFHLEKSEIFEVHNVRYEKNEPYECLVHFHEVHELILFHDVTGTYSHVNGIQEVNPRDLVFTAANEVHTFDVTSENKAWTVIQFVPTLLSDSGLRKIANKFDKSTVFSFDNETYDFLKTLCVELSKCYQNDSGCIQANYLLKLIISTIAEQGAVAPMKDDYVIKLKPAFSRLTPLLKLLQQPDPINLTMVEAAEICFLSPSHFSRLFKSVYKVSYSEFKNKQRVYCAARQMAHRNCSITDLSYEFNFANPSHFINQFKRQFGLTPKQYQKRYSV